MREVKKHVRHAGHRQVVANKEGRRGLSVAGMVSALNYLPFPRACARVCATSDVDTDELSYMVRVRNGC